MGQTWAVRCSTCSCCVSCVCAEASLCFCFQLWRFCAFNFWLLWRNVTSSCCACMVPGHHILRCALCRRASCLLRWKLFAWPPLWQQRIGARFFVTHMFFCFARPWGRGLTRQTCAKRSCIALKTVLLKVGAYAALLSFFPCFSEVGSAQEFFDWIDGHSCVFAAYQACFVFLFKGSFLCRGRLIATFICCSCGQNTTFRWWWVWGALWTANASPLTSCGVLVFYFLFLEQLMFLYDQQLGRCTVMRRSMTSSLQSSANATSVCLRGAFTAANFGAANAANFWIVRVALV